MQSLLLALRSLRKDLRVTATVLLLLSLGLGANAAIFAVADALVFRPPSGVDAPERVRRLHSTSAYTPDGSLEHLTTFNYRELAELRTALAPRARLTAYVPDSVFAGPERSEKVRVTWVGRDYFDVLGVTPSTGRFFAPEETVMGTPVEVVVLSDAYWRRRFGGDPSVIGATLDLGHQRPLVVGVAPPYFRGTNLDPAEVWMPVAARVERPVGDVPWFESWRAIREFTIVARLADDVSETWLAEAATSVLRSVAAEDYGRSRSILVASGPLQEALAPSREGLPASSIVTRLLVFGALVVALTCANVANLLLARSVQRRRQHAVQTALGMSRARLVGELLGESLVLSVLAAAVALATSGFAAGELRRLVAPAVAWETPPVDLRVAAFTLALALLVGAAAALAPVLSATRRDLNVLLNAGSRAGGGRPSPLRSLILAGQGALSLVLLVGAGLLTLSWLRVSGIDLGHDAGSVITATLEFRSEEGFREPGGARLVERMPLAAEALRGHPAIENTALAALEPMQSYIVMHESFFRPDGSVVPSTSGQTQALQAVTPSYFATIGLRLRGGRLLTEGDRQGTPVILVSESTARALWPQGDAVGQCLVVVLADQPCREVVGVVEDAHVLEVLEAPAIVVYTPLGHEDRNLWNPRTPGTLIARVRADQAAAAIDAMRDRLRVVFPDADRIRITPMVAVVDAQLHPWRLSATLFALLGGLAVIIAALGVFSVVTYGVNERMHDLSIRVAIGAAPRHIVAVVMNLGVGPVCLGIGAGMVLVLAAGKLAAPLLYRTSPLEPAVIAVAIGVLLFVAAAASLAPGRRALRADPVAAMRA